MFFFKSFSEIKLPFYKSYMKDGNQKCAKYIIYPNTNFTPIGTGKFGNFNF